MNDGQSFTVDARALESFHQRKETKRGSHESITFKTTSHPISLQAAKHSKIPVAVSSKTCRVEQFQKINRQIIKFSIVHHKQIYKVLQHIKTLARPLSYL